jgi:hypothetical protein
MLDLGNFVNELKLIRIKMSGQLSLKLFDPFDQTDFYEKAAELYEQQVNCSHILNNFAKIAHMQGAPYCFFPAAFFTSESVYLSDKNPELLFSSSGTSGLLTARHKVAQADIYDYSHLSGFKEFFPGLKEQKPAILALLPSYLERGDSSLVYMVRRWVEKFGHPMSGFYLDNFSQLEVQLKHVIQNEVPLLLIGVTYALLDFFDQYPIKLPQNSVLIETGGMKGRKKEIIRSEVHKILMQATGLPSICSEYGMTELLSQAYSTGNGRFQTPYWMRVEIRDLNDVNLPVPEGKSGRICIIDLANKWSCAFIATGDIGRSYADGSFELLGRADTAGSRGCSLLYNT